MKHMKRITTGNKLPETASLLETQQKVAVFAALAAAIGTLGSSIGVFLDLRNDA